VKRSAANTTINILAPLAMQEFLVFSFDFGKTITTGEEGLILTNKKKIIK